MPRKWSRPPTEVSGGARSACWPARASLRRYPTRRGRRSSSRRAATPRTAGSVLFEPHYHRAPRTASLEHHGLGRGGACVAVSIVDGPWLGDHAEWRKAHLPSRVMPETEGRVAPLRAPLPMTRERRADLASRHRPAHERHRPARLQQNRASAVVRVTRNEPARSESAQRFSQAFKRRIAVLRVRAEAVEDTDTVGALEIAVYPPRTLELPSGSNVGTCTASLRVFVMESTRIAGANKKGVHAGTLLARSPHR